MSKQNEIRIQGRRWSLILWVDDKTYPECHNIIITAINKFQENHRVKYAFILHDRDTYNANDYINYCNNNLGELPPWNVGDNKPKHYHIYLEFDSKVDLKHIFRTFDELIESKYIWRINNDSMYIRYLIHCDNEDKFQYSELEIVSNIDNIDLYFIDKNYTTCENTNFVRMLTEYLDSSTNKKSFKAVAKWCLENGFSDILLKHSYFVKCLIDDKD